MPRRKRDVAHRLDGGRGGSGEAESPSKQIAARIKELAGWRGEILLVRVSEPPVDGRANQALERLIARTLGVPKVRVGIVSGARGREKTVAVEGLTQAEALDRLREALPP